MAILKTINTKGKYYDIDSKDIVVNYILKESKTLGGYTGASGINTENYAEEMKTVSEKFGKSDGVQLRHFVISFKQHEVSEPEVAWQIGNKISKFLGTEFQNVFSVHENTDQLHIHLVMNSVSFVDGHRYYGTRKEFYSMKNYTDKVLDDYGIGPMKYKSNKK